MSSTNLETELSEEALEKTRTDWRGVGLSTQPADASLAVKGISQAYQAAGLKPPKYVIWLGSPRAGAIAGILLTSTIDWPERLDPFQRMVWDSVWKQCVRQVEQDIGVEKWHELRSRLRKEATEYSDRKWGQYVEKQVKSLFAERMGIWIWDHLRQRAGKSEGAKVIFDAREKVRAAVAKQTSDQLQTKVMQQIMTELHRQVSMSVREPVRQSITVNHGPLSDYASWPGSFGQHDCELLAYYDFMKNVLGIKGTESLDGMKTAARACGWWWPFENLCIISERPTAIHRDNRARLHHESTMALRYPDGWGLYAWNGILVPEYVITLPEPITFEMIEAEPNAEVRRVLIERFGLDNYLRAGKCIKLHQDKTGILYRMNLPGDEPILVVQVINSTPEPDGVFKEYFLRVPPGMVRARQAVAWTFGLTEEEYFPLAET